MAPGMAAMAGGYAGGGAGAGVGMGGMGALGLDPAAMFAQVQAHLARAGAMGGGVGLPPGMGGAGVPAGGANLPLPPASNPASTVLSLTVGRYKLNPVYP